MSYSTRSNWLLAMGLITFLLLGGPAMARATNDTVTHQGETVPIFESSVGRGWQYRYDPNITDSEISSVFDRIGRGESRVNFDYLYACEADSIVPYLASENYDIKTRAIFVLGSIGDTTAVMVLAEIMSPVFLTLSDSDLNHANQALSNIDSIIRRQHLLVSNLPLLHPYLMKYALERSHYIPMAIDLIGKTENPEYLAPIIIVRDRARESIARRDSMSSVGEKRYEACLRAMAKLGDQESRQEIIDKLHNPDPLERGRAVGYVAYVGEEFAHYLLPLLDDREHTKPKPEMSDTIAGLFCGDPPDYYRVCDLAVRAVADIYQLSIFPPYGEPVYYSDQQLADVKKWLTVRLAKQ